MTHQLRFGVVGLGFGASLMLPDLASHQAVHLAGAADPRPAARSYFVDTYGGKAFPTAEELFHGCSLDAVYIASPSDLHQAHALAAAAVGLHIIVEKPMALTLDECKHVMHAVKEAGIHLVCGHTHMFDPPIAAMAGLVREGELGAPMHVLTINYTDIMYRPRAAWELDSSRGGGVVFMQAPHQVDIIRRISGRDPTSIRAVTFTSDPERGVEGGYAALLQLEGEASATLVYSGYGYFDSSVLHYGRGERGQLRAPSTHGQTWADYLASTVDGARRLDDGERREARRLGGGPSQGVPTPPVFGRVESHPFFGLTVVSCERGDITQDPTGLVIHDRSGSVHHEVPMEPTAGAAVISELADAIRTGQSPSHGVDWAALTVRTCLAMVASAEAGAEVSMELSASAITA